MAVSRADLINPAIRLRPIRVDTDGYGSGVARHMICGIAVQQRYTPQLRPASSSRVKSRSIYYAGLRSITVVFCVLSKTYGDDGKLIIPWLGVRIPRGPPWEVKSGEQPARSGAKIFRWKWVPGRPGTAGLLQHSIHEIYLSSGKRFMVLVTLSGNPE
jgi:hypothetical protein